MFGHRLKREKHGRASTLNVRPLAKHAAGMAEVKSSLRGEGATQGCSRIS
jgi:hypothetical protein